MDAFAQSDSSDTKTVGAVVLLGGVELVCAMKE